ncbi:MAG: replication initiation protein RepC [Pseudomonadota bacterium]
MGVDIPTIPQSCPEFANWPRQLGGYVRRWGDLVRVASNLGPVIGTTEPVWIHVQAQMGKPTAAAALALVFDKVRAGTVNSPVGICAAWRTKQEQGTCIWSAACSGDWGRVQRERYQPGTLQIFHRMA